MNFKAHYGSRTMNTLSHLFMAVMFYGFNTISCLVCLASFVRPESPEFLSSLLDDPKGLSVGARLAFASFQLYYEIVFHGNAFMWTFNTVMSATLQISILKYIR